ncbi:ABC transporter substrate-binding protein [Prosthecomicrobium pneumaticum]|uniref:Multiple sugar transport system substrate-binding protein n=1 Tax=Prosthecomicrobium pneumaticum TaxID=81895 RepID=A0A7W9CT44_9HYPH|nr:extracellular solute-binding protein [Prosthecomicrobium pneumaticum]MBB5751433.1 multiple sugar transport system substrate-binding protein [Prosthecomicrobium pneumaticum]
MKFRSTLLASATLAGFLGAASVAAAETTLTFVWHAGTCADALVGIAKDYPDKSVKIVPALVPYGPEWHNKIASEFAIKGDAFDFAMWDSQSTAEFAGGGHVVKMNDIFAQSSYLKADLFPPASLSQYGEYPDGSGQFYGLPANQDAYGLMYRKDLFESAEEKAAFKAKYGRELRVPETYQEAKEVAEFFTRPDKGLYGWGQMGGRDYDFATTASNSFLWSFGGELYNPKTNEIAGYLNSPASIDGVQAYVDMFKFGPPGSGNWGFDEVNASFQQGQLAMAMQWFYFNGSNADPKVNKFAGVTGFGILPGAVGRDGKFRRQFSVGGQGMGINKYSKKLPELVKFMEWYFQPEQQKRYAAVCQTGLRAVLESPDWQGLNSYNAQFANALQYLNDYWHLPEYPVLLDILQEEVSNAISGSKTVEEALGDAAKRQERTLERAGYTIEHKGDAPDVPDTVISPVGQDAIVPVNG